MITKDEILNLENTLYRAIKNNDVEILDSLLHADLLFIIPSDQTIAQEKYGVLCQAILSR